MKLSFYGLFAKPLSYIVPIKKKSWVFGCDYGRTFREGSKYMIEYMLKNHPDYECTFITRSKSVKVQLKKLGIPCLMNFSFKGIRKVLRAEVAITTQVPTDVYFFYKKRNKKFIFLSHGQPYKAVFLATPKEYLDAHLKPSVSIISKIEEKIRTFLTGSYQYWESAFYTSTSEWLIPYNKLYYGKNADVRILGMPRNDAFYDNKQMEKERWIPDTEGKLVITYMPTHRDFGRGGPCPIPFINSPKKLSWLRNNNVLLVVKQHPNTHINNAIKTDTIIDITKMGLDPQVVQYHSSALITDYSSVWIDYIMLKRPILFYLDKKYETDDLGALYDIRKEAPGHFCYTEDELFELIRKVKEHYDEMRPSEEQVHKFHKYVDGNSCQRYYEAIVFDKYKE